MASMAMRMTVLNTSCAVSDQPEVREWVPSGSDALGRFLYVGECRLRGGMVPGEGIEPPTFGLQNRCTTAVLTRLRPMIYQRLTR